MKQTHVLFAAAAICCTAASAFAGKISITADGIGDFHLKSTNLPGLFSNAPGHQFTGSELQSIHQSINAAGINTEGVVTIILGNTSAGLSLFALVDNNITAGPKDLDAMLGINTSLEGTGNYVNNDNNFFANGGTFSDNGSEQSLAGDFFWHPDGGATGMAWTGLDHGDRGDFDFSALLGPNGTFAGLTNVNTFQFVSWTGTTWNLKRVGSFDGSGSFSFAFAVMPVPPALAMGLAGIGVVAIARRRRGKKA